MKVGGVRKFGKMTVYTMCVSIFLIFVFPFHFLVLKRQIRDETNGCYDVTQGTG